MRKFELFIEMENASFGYTPTEREAEVSRILREVADQLDRMGCRLNYAEDIRDINGNKVGSWVEKQED